MSKSRAVFDTSPLIFLDSLEYIDVVQVLFDIFAPPMVVQELSEYPDRAGGQLRERAGIEESVPSRDALARAETLNVDAGETSAIALALDLDCLVILDDAVARKRARPLNLSVMGTVGILFLLEEHDLNKRSLEEDLDRLVRNGMWLGKKLIQDLLSSRPL